MPSPNSIEEIDIHRGTEHYKFVAETNLFSQEEDLSGSDQVHDMDGDS